MQSEKFEDQVGEAVGMVSQTQRYQKKMIVLTVIVCLQSAFAHLLNSTVFTNPLFKCGDSIVAESIACQNMSECRIENDYTGTYHAGLYCENSHFRMDVQALFAPGILLGLMIFSVMADTRGRKFASCAMIACMSGSLICLIFSIYFRILWLIAVAQFMSGFGLSASLNVCYTLANELFNEENRKKSIMLFLGSWSMAEVIVLFIYYISPSWYTYLVIVQLLPSLYATHQFCTLMKETPQFLITVNKDVQSSLDVIEYIGNYNGASQSEIDAAKYKVERAADLYFINEGSLTEVKGTREILWEFISNKQLLKAVICLGIIKFGFYAFYYGALGCLERTGFNFGISIFILGAGEMLGYSTSNYFLDRFPRKTMLIVSNLCKAFIGLTLMTSVISESAVMSSIVLALTFLLGAYNFSAITMIENETFSTSTQSTAIGIIFFLSYTSRFFLPYLIGEMNEEGIHPLIACSLLLIVLGITPSCFLNQTSKKKPESLQLIPRSKEFELDMISTPSSFRSRKSRASYAFNTAQEMNQMH